MIRSEWLAPSEIDQTTSLAVAYEDCLQKVVKEITDKMSKLDCTTDGVQLFVNGFGMWCAKFKTRQGVVYFAFHRSSLGALQKLRDDPQQEQSVYGRE